MIAAEVHLVLVSDQLLPNLLPALDSTNRPEQVVLLATAEKREQAERLAKLFTATGCKSLIRETSAYRVDEIDAAVAAMIAESSGKKLALNATGGTKIMALAAFAQFYSLDLPIFYVDSGNQQVIQLGPRQQTFALPDRLTIKTALTCFGYRIESRLTPALQPENIALYRALVEDMSRWTKPLAELNHLAGRAKNAPYVDINPAWRANEDLHALLDLFGRAGHLSYDQDGRLIFAAEESRRLVQGGWLEHWVYAQVEQLKRKGSVRDAAVSLQVSNPHGTRNEIDVVLAAANRLHLIECKTAQFKEGRVRADDLVYKLDNLTDLMGGTFGRALLVSWHPLRPEDRQRCQDNGIAIASGRDLTELPRILAAWIKS